MRALIIIILTFLSIQNGYSQQALDLEEIKRLTKDSASEYFYDTLVQRFLVNPHSFDQTKGTYLYYGKLYSGYYKIFNFNEEATTFNRLLSKRSYKKALPIGENILKNDPVNLEILAKMQMCYASLNDTQRMDLTTAKVFVLQRAIRDSGTGESKELAYKMVAIGDEYALMAMLDVQGLTRKSYMYASSTLDSWKVRNRKTGEQRDLHLEVLINKAAMPDFSK